VVYFVLEMVLVVGNVYCLVILVIDSVCVTSVSFCIVELDVSVI